MGVTAVLRAAEEAARRADGLAPDLVFVSECDGFRSTAHEAHADGWRVYRTCPGDGSFAMAWFVRQSIVPHVCSVVSRGRVHAIDRAGGPRPAGGPQPAVGSRIRLIGVHGLHESCLVSS